MKSFRATPIHPQVFLILFIALFQCSALLAGHAGKESTREMDELFRDGFIPRIRIQIPPEGVAELRKYNWRRDGSSDDKVGVQGTVSEGGKTFSNVFIRVKGSAGSFRSIDQNPGLTLNFDKLADGQRFHGLQKLSLNNSIQDASLCSDQFSRELYRKVGVPVPRAGHARVFLNNRDLGLYVLTEGWNKQFLNQFFHKPDGNLYDCTFAKEVGPMMHVNCGVDPFDQSDLDELLAAAELASRKKSLRPLECLDVDRFLRLLVLDGLLWNWDGYAIGHNNYRVFHDFDSQKLIFMPHGMDQMFWRPDAPIMPGGKAVIGKAVLASREGRDRYMALAREYLDSWFNSDDLIERLEQISESLQPELRQIGPAAQARQQRGLGILRTLIRLRLSSLRQQLAGTARLVRLETGESLTITNWPQTSQNNASIRLRSNGDHSTADTLVWLEVGYYRIEGRVRTTGVKSSSNDGEPGGAGFRATSDRKPSVGPTWDWFPFRESPDREKRAELTTPNGRDERAVGDSAWRTLAYDFELHQPIADIKVSCDLRAEKGEAWFDPGSIKITRLPAPKKPPVASRASR